MTRKLVFLGLTLLNFGYFLFVPKPKVAYIGYALFYLMSAMLI